MKTSAIFVVALATLLLAGTSWAHSSGVTEIKEGTIRNLYVKKPLVGAKGYVVGALLKGLVRVEVMNFPPSETGYEVFLFKINRSAFYKAMFVDADPLKGVAPNPPPFKEVAALIEQWHSLGDLKMDGKGHGTLEYRKGDNLWRLNMIMVFEKKTGGRHKAPEDFGGLMVECNGPLEGSSGSGRHSMDVKVF